jgi:hypothetical protein
MSHRSRSCALVIAVLVVGCPRDDARDTGAVDSESASDSETGAGDGDGDDDKVGEPTCPASVRGRYDVFAEPVLTPAKIPPKDLDAICKPAEDAFGLSVEWSNQDEFVDLIIYRPALSDSSDWPPGRFPVVFHHHGQGQDGAEYEHIAKAVVNDGAIFVSVAGIKTMEPDKRALIDICMLRWFFTTKDWNGTTDGTAGLAQLDGNVVIMGHSNGGEAAHIVAEWFEEQPWAHDETAPEHDMRLCGVIGIAPRGAELDNAPFSTDQGPGIDIAGEATVPYLTIEGSLDNDVPGGSLWNGSHSGFDELHTPTDAAKISVWVYDAEHDSFGGGGAIAKGDTRGALKMSEQRARGEFVAQTWIDAFVRRFLFGDLASEAILFGHELPEGLDVPKWWDYHPAYVGEPLVFLGVEPHQSPAEGEQGVRVIVDTMCRWSEVGTCTPGAIDNGHSTSSEGHDFFAANWPANSLRSDFASSLAKSQGNYSSYYTFALRADFTAPGAGSDPIERTIAWDVSSYSLADASTFSFRAASVDDVDYPGPGKGCSPVDGDSADAVGFDVIFVSATGLEVRVDVSDYTRLAAPDIFEITGALGNLECPVSHFLQTVTIPLDEVLCDAFPPEDLREVRFVFDRTEGLPGRAVLLDTVEFHRELSGPPPCGA